MGENKWNEDSARRQETGKTSGMRLIKECTVGGNSVHLHWTQMFSNDIINHCFILSQTSRDWVIDPCGEGKHPLGWLQCGSVDSILHAWSFFHPELGLYHYCDEGVVLPSLFLLSQYTHTAAISTLSQVTDGTSGLKLPPVCNSQEENNINTNINFQLDCPFRAFCLPVNWTATLLTHMFRL